MSNRLKLTKELIAVGLTLVGVACGTGANVSHPLSRGNPGTELGKVTPPSPTPSTRPDPRPTQVVRPDPCEGETRVGYCGNTGGSGRVITLTSLERVTITPPPERIVQTSTQTVTETVTSVQTVTSTQVVTLPPQVEFRDTTQIVSIVGPSSTRVITQSPGEVNEWNITEPGTVVYVFHPDTGSTQVITMNSVLTITATSIQTVTLTSTSVVTETSIVRVTVQEPGINTTVTVTDCPVVTTQLTFPLQAFSAADAALDLPLPYRSTGAPRYTGRQAHQFPLFELGSSSIPTLSNGLPSLNNAQLRFKADLRLPRIGAIAQVLDTTLELDAVKNLDLRLAGASERNYLRTEIFCFLDARICSGEMASATNYAGNFNPAFWGTTENHPNGDPQHIIFNDAFATQLMAGLINHRTERRSTRMIEYHNPRLSIVLNQENSSRLGVAGSSNVTLTDLIYGRYVRNDQHQLVEAAQSSATDSGNVVSRTLRMSVADDTVILGGNIKITIQGNSCTFRANGIVFERNQ